MFERVSIDEVRRFWNARPCNIRHSPKPVGTREYFDEVERRKYFVEPHIPLFADFARWNGRRVLELGCGIGTDTVRFAKAGGLVTAVDLSDRSLALARQRCETYGLSDRVRFVVADAEDLASRLPPEPFDLIYSFGVLHHTPDPERALAQLPRYSRSGTVLKVMVYHRHSWKVFRILLRHPLSRNPAAWIARHSEAQTGCPVTYTYTRQEFRGLLVRHGWRVTGLSVEHIFPWRVPDYVAHRYVKAWPFRWIPAPVLRGLERRIGWHLCATAVRP